MRVSDAVKKWADVLGTEIQIEGIAEISGYFSVIYDEEYRKKRNTGDLLPPGILIHGDYMRLAADSLPTPIDCYCGSEIHYVVKVRVIGIITNSGHSFAPLKFGHIYEIEFEDENAGLQKLTLNSRLVDISFRVNRTLLASEVKHFQNYFPESGNLVDLKKFLESGENIFLAKRVSENEVAHHLQYLKQIDVEYELRDSPIENGFLGLP